MSNDVKVFLWNMTHDAATLWIFHRAMKIINYRALTFTILSCDVIGRALRLKVLIFQTRVHPPQEPRTLRTTLSPRHTATKSALKMISMISMISRPRHSVAANTALNTTLHSPRGGEYSWGRSLLMIHGTSLQHMQQRHMGCTTR